MANFIIRLIVRLCVVMYYYWNNRYIRFRDLSSVHTISGMQGLRRWMGDYRAGIDQRKAANINPLEDQK